MNIEISRNARSCHKQIDYSSRARNFWSTGMERASMASRCQERKEAAEKTLRTTKALKRIKEDTVLSSKEQKRNESRAYMESVLNGMGLKQSEMETYSLATLYILMALKETGKEDLVRDILKASPNDYEWQIYLRETGV